MYITLGEVDGAETKVTCLEPRCEETATLYIDDTCVEVSKRGWAMIPHGQSASWYCPKHKKQFNVTVEEIEK
jgi:hypothetical protein